MFLLPCLALGIALAIALGGNISRVLAVRFRATVLVPAALGIQIAVFSPFGERFLATTGAHLHLLSYALLIIFALLNIRLQGLWPVFAGTSLNAVAIAANGGAMPLSSNAAAAAGLEPGWNISDQVDRLWFLGDVFALPARLPLANVFSVGDLLIGLGMAGFIIYASLGSGRAEATLSPSRLIQPLRVASFRRLAAGKLVSQLGDWLTLAALVGWLYGETASTEHVAGLLLVRLGPPILGGSLAVFLVDRLPKKNLLITVELARGIAVGGALLGILSGELALVYAALAVSGGLAALSSAAVPALVPSLVPDEQLPAANASLEIGKDGAMALGAAAAGVALAYVGAEVALAVDLGTFVVASLLYAGLRIPAAVRHEEDGGDGEERTKGGLRYVLGHRRLLVLILSFATATLATGLTNASLPQFFGGEGGLGSAGYGFAIAALASGLLVGETMVGFAKVGPTAGRWIGAALLVMAGLFGLLCLTEHAPTALLLLGFIGFVDGTTDVLFDTVAQRETDPRYLGSVFGFASAFMAATMTGAFVAAPLANELLDSKFVILAAGVVLAVAGLIALLAMRAPKRREAAAAELAPPRVHREGSDLSLVVCGAVLDEAERAADALAPAVSVEVLAILDLELLLESVRKTSKVAVLHDGNGSGPLAAELAAALGELAWHDLDAPVTRVSAEEDDVVACLRAVAAY